MTITRKAALISFLASLLILAVKFWAYAYTGSTALLSDALESIVNVMAAGFALSVMRVVESPADKEHPYGHGKLEYFSAAFEGGLIAFAGIMIAREAGLAWFEGRVPRNLDSGMALALIAAGANLVLGLYLRTVGRRQRSEALISSGQHVLTDVWSTIGVLIGLALVRLTGLTWFDPLAALAISIQLSYSGYKIVRRSAGGLMDEVEEHALKDLALAFQKNRRPGVIDIHLAKLIRSGRFHHIDCHLVVPEFLQVIETHAMMEDFEKDVVATYPFDGEINFHLDPCFRDYCSTCDYPDCPVRRHPFNRHRVFTAESMTNLPERDQT